MAIVTSSKFTDNVLIGESLRKNVAHGIQPIQRVRGSMVSHRVPIPLHTSSSLNIFIIVFLFVSDWYLSKNVTHNVAESKEFCFEIHSEIFYEIFILETRN